jgi:hypothetical protein
MGNARFVSASRLPLLVILTKILDLHKVYVDDDSYNSGHGRAYEFYGVDPVQGAVVIVRPDQCEFFHSKPHFGSTNMKHRCFYGASY